MIVEDVEVIARAVQQSLVSWGMDAFCVQDFSGVLAEFAVKNPQLVLMDIHLPFFNGFHWCQEIRKVSKVPVIFLSSASDNMNIIMAPEPGIPDTVQPFQCAVFFLHPAAECLLAQRAVALSAVFIRNMPCNHARVIFEHFRQLRIDDSRFFPVNR